MILYVQTPAMPRSELHTRGCIRGLKFLDNCEQFSEIRWFINIDVTTSSNYDFEDYSITHDNFKNFTDTLSKTKTEINISHEPCFYLAFRHLTLAVQEDVINSKLNDDEYCVMWFEDDFYIEDESGFNNYYDIFSMDDDIKVMTMYHNKINMGGNPDIIKGDTFRYFDEVNLDIDTKRDPEWIRKMDVFYKHVWIDPWPEQKYSFGQKLVMCNPSDGCREYDGVEGTNTSDFIHSRTINTKVLSTDTAGDVGDEWRDSLNVSKCWFGQHKPGISKDRSYTYK